MRPRIIRSPRGGAADSRRGGGALHGEFSPVSTRSSDTSESAGWVRGERTGEASPPNQLRRELAWRWSLPREPEWLPGLLPEKLRVEAGTHNRGSRSHAAAKSGRRLWVGAVWRARGWVRVWRRRMATLRSSCPHGDGHVRTVRAWALVRGGCAARTRSQWCGASRARVSFRGTCAAAACWATRTPS